MDRTPPGWMTAVKLAGALAVVLLVALLALRTHGDRARATTPEEFVEKYSAAYRSKDVDAVVEMTAEPRVPAGARATEEMRREAAAFDRAKERQDVEEEMKREGTWFRAWSAARFEATREQGDHVRVEVSVLGTRTEVVLVREGGALKIHPRPSWFD